MIVSLRALPLAIILAAGTPALAQDTAPAQEAEVAPTDPSSPDFVRCKRVDVIGSRAKKERICKTNAEWERTSRVGNDLSRDTVDRSQSIYRAEGM